MTEERVTVSLRLRPGAVERLDEIASSRDVSRAVVLREAVGALLNGPAPTALRKVNTAEGGHRLSEVEWRRWLWLNDFAEKCYLGADPITIGTELYGARFSLMVREDPDLATA